MTIGAVIGGAALIVAAVVNITLAAIPATRHLPWALVGPPIIALAEELAAMRDAGVQHIGLHFRRNRRPLDETMSEIATPKSAAQSSTSGSRLRGISNRSSSS